MHSNKAKYLISIFSITLVLMTCGLSFAQSPDSDSSGVIGKSKDTPVSIVDKSHSPKKAILFSMAVPGLGQFYNGMHQPAANGKLRDFKKFAYLKIPVIYALGGYLTYSVINYHKDYTGFRDALFLREDGDSTTTDNVYTGIYSDEGLRVRKDFNRRNRDLNIIYLLGMYAIQIADAAVDAHLIGFNIKDEFIMSFEPTLLAPGSYAPLGTPGLSININFL